MLQHKGHYLVLVLPLQQTKTLNLSYSIKCENDLKATCDKFNEAQHKRGFNPK